MHRARRSRLVLGAFCACWTTGAVAEQAPPYPALLRQSLEGAPALLEQAANVRAARADARQARAWPNPSAEAVFENLAAPRAGGAVERQDTFSVTQPLDLLKRGGRVAASDREAALSEARARQVEVAFAKQLAIAYARAEAATVRARLADEGLGRAADELRAAEALVKAGKEAALRAVQARASVASERSSAAEASAERQAALLELSELAGVDQAFTGVEPFLLSSAASVRGGAGRAAGSLPAVAAAAAERDTFIARERVERERARPDLGVSVGLRRFGGTGGEALVLGVSASIPIFDRNRAGVAAARERTLAAEQRLRATRARAAADRASADGRAAANAQRIDAAGQSVDAAREAYRLGRIGYDAGKTSLLELLAIRRALADAERGLVDAQLARVEALAALAEADGRIAFGE